jgi:hypothetical protein
MNRFLSRILISQEEVEEYIEKAERKKNANRKYYTQQSDLSEMER